jgi:hypothetical protein
MPLRPSYIGQPDCSYTTPAQSPQKVLVKINRWSMKRFSMSQSPWKLATGVPNSVVSGSLVVRLSGALPRGKNQILMPSSCHSVT